MHRYREAVLAAGRIHASPILGRLHHQYVRIEFPIATGGYGWIGMLKNLFALG
jgi:hypothetical protein